MILNNGIIMNLSKDQWLFFIIFQAKGFIFFHFFYHVLGELLIYVTCFDSVSSLMTTTEAIVVELPKEEKEATPAMGGGMGGMDY